MPGLVPGIHVPPPPRPRPARSTMPQDVDARNKSGHDGWGERRTGECPPRPTLSPPFGAEPPERRTGQQWNKSGHDEVEGRPKRGPLRFKQGRMSYGTQRMSRAGAGRRKGAQPPAAPWSLSVSNRRAEAAGAHPSIRGAACPERSRGAATQDEGEVVGNRKSSHPEQARKRRIEGRNADTVPFKTDTLYGIFRPDAVVPGFRAAPTSPLTLTLSPSGGEGTLPHLSFPSPLPLAEGAGGGWIVANP